MATDAPTPGRGSVIGQGLSWTARWSLRLLLTAASLLGLLVAQLWSIVFPVLMAVLVATVLWPPAAWLRRHRFPPAAASGVVLLVGLGVVGGLVTIVSTSVSGSIAEIATNVSAGIGSIGTWLSGPPFNPGDRGARRRRADRHRAAGRRRAAGALPLAVITFLGGFIPIVGAVVAGALAVLVALVTNGFTSAVIVALIVLAVQQIEGNVLSPILQSRSLGLHAAVVLLAVTAGSTLYGIAGAFLSVPVVAAGAVVLRYLGEVIDARTGQVPGDADDGSPAGDTRAAPADGSPEPG